MKPRYATMIATALLLGASACGTDAGDAQVATERSSVPSAPTIAFVGDSITEQSKPAIERAGRARGFATDVDATSGFMTREKQEAAEAAAGRHPVAAVMALGTNDAVCQLTNALVSGSCRYSSFTLADMEADLDRMAATLGQPGTCVVGVTVYFGEEVGTHLEQLVAAGELDGIVDWRTAVTADETLRADGIGHLTAKGEEAYARFVLDETIRICGL